MSEDQTTQAVVDETKVPASQGTEAPGARTDDGDLDALLSQWDQPSSNPSDTATPATAAPAAADKDAKRLDALEQKIHQQEFQKEIGPVIESIKQAIPEGVLNDDEILDLLDARAKRDPRLANAWLDRSRNPQGWKKVQDGLARDFSKRFSRLPDPAATEDRAAVTAAVRGSSQRAPEAKAPDYGKMSPAEFEAEVAKYT